MSTRMLVVGVCLGGAIACSRQPDPPPFKPVATLEQLMEGTVMEAADVYWKSVATIVDKNGITEIFPKTDEEWEHVRGSAITIAESGNLLMMAPRAKDNDEWMKMSAALIDVGMDAAKAAESKDPEKVLAAGERVYDVCTRCHMRYIVEEGKEAPGAPGK